jgi:trehalose 6-phosphate synthase/phosphatase
MMHEQKTQRIIIVSNRLPVTVSVNNGAMSFTESVGGLATGLRSLLNAMENPFPFTPKYLWVGWPGNTINDDMKESVKSKLFFEHNSHPVFLSESDVENFYQGFCNKTIWPLFHYFPSLTKYDQQYWTQYKNVNQAFRDALAEILQPDDIVWIHDYHLMLLPNLLREKIASLSIGFFLHIPFPHYELFRLLPAQWRKEILEGLLGSNLIGFHTHDYMQYFLHCVIRILGYEHTMGQLALQDRIVKAETFPMGIDFQKFHSAACGTEVQRERDELQKSLANSKVILSIDRLDYTKGILHRLQGYETMLETNPSWHGKVTLLMIVVPSRIGVQDYDLQKKQIEELVGRINGKYGTVSWTPIIYQYKSLPFETLVAMYSMSDVALVTPLRDGMNLIAKEYIASRTEKTGVLVLSEMAGAAKELGEAIIINPNNREEIAAAMKDALEMPQEQQLWRNSIMQNRLQRYDVMRWATDQLKELLSATATNEKLYVKLLNSARREKLIQEYNAATHRLLFLDYDGTLISFVKHPKLAKPGKNLLATLRSLADDPRNEVILISGRKKDELGEWFGSLPIGIVAEHGAWLKAKNSDWRMLRQLNNDWKPRLFPLLERYADRLPGSFVEEKDFSLVWHYRAVDPEQGTLAARELTDDLTTFTANIDIQVIQGHKIVEVRCTGINKGIASKEWLSKGTYDFILAIGDDWTDEDLFAVLPETAYSLHVGFNQTHARYNVRDPKDVVRILEQLLVKS